MEPNPYENISTDIIEHNVKLSQVELDMVESDQIESNQTESDTIECIFCKESNKDLYKSTVCKCTHVYFCKECVTRYQSDSKSCPQCRTPLNLTVSIL